MIDLLIDWFSECMIIIAFNLYRVISYRMFRELCLLDVYIYDFFTHNPIEYE